MALRGTLKDFGIADIFQLIGHQGKSGRLTVKNRDNKVIIYFHQGQVVRAAALNRSRRDLLGAMMVRGEVLTETELKRALQIQRDTLKRLGAILVENDYVTQEALQKFTRLQTTETLYRLFLWTSGSYEFEAGVIESDADSALIRSENVLMEGFRQVDEWPAIRRVITGYALTFQVLEDLDELIASSDQAGPTPEEDPFGLDDAFGEMGLDGAVSQNPRLRNIDDNGQLVYQLVQKGRDVQKIIDLSRLGEFDTCKALINLIEADIIAPHKEVEGREPSADATVGGITSGRSSWLRMMVWAVAVLSVGVGAWLGVMALGLRPKALFELRTRVGYQGLHVQELLGRAQLGRLRHAIAIYRAEEGDYPDNLEKLVKVGLLTQDDVRFPFRESYFYERRGDTYVLMRPLF